MHLDFSGFDCFLLTFVEDKLLKMKAIPSKSPKIPILLHKKRYFQTYKILYLFVLKSNDASDYSDSLHFLGGFGRVNYSILFRFDIPISSRNALDDGMDSVK